MKTKFASFLEASNCSLLLHIRSMNAFRLKKSAFSSSLKNLDISSLLTHVWDIVFVAMFRLYRITIILIIRVCSFCILMYYKGHCLPLTNNDIDRLCEAREDMRLYLVLAIRLT